MQPQGLHAHARVKYTPTYIQNQLECRLFGNTFRSVAEAARHYGLAYSTAYEYHNKELHREAFPNRKRWNTWK